MNDFFVSLQQLNIVNQDLSSLICTFSNKNSARGENLANPSNGHFLSLILIEIVSFSLTKGPTFKQKTYNFCYLLDDFSLHFRWNLLNEEKTALVPLSGIYR